ncbi:MAG: 16S rRNA (adenine(1518)-N(6)/adenine(1519)-N(6))-dimethyltransferase RsmA [Candidatus Paceibacterota bacterium]|jgi:16S rRNA (adenine1518-N6/adenine1519-N6)-dimethyltransferase
MRRRLGQHFLTSELTLEKIAAASQSAGAVIIEIGPGHGELTKYLCKNSARVTVLERDSRLADELRADKRFWSVEVIEGNALVTLPLLVARLEKEKTPYVLVGNIPYYITGRLLHIVGDVSYKPIHTVLLIQKEVALRLCANPPHMNLLAAIVQAWASPTILFSVPRGLFSPPPEVDSAVVMFETRASLPSHHILLSYYAFMRILFRHPRKTILNNLLECANVSRDDVVGRCGQIGVNSTHRPQTLSPEMLEGLFYLFAGSF